MKIWRRKYRWDFFCGGGWYKESPYIPWNTLTDASYGILNDDAMQVLPLLSADITFVITQTGGAAVTTMPIVTARGTNVADGFDFNTFAGTGGPFGGFDGNGDYVDDAGTPAANPGNGSYNAGVGNFDSLGNFVGVGLGTYIGQDAGRGFNYDVSGYIVASGEDKYIGFGQFDSPDGGSTFIYYGDSIRAWTGNGDYDDDVGTPSAGGMGHGLYDSGGSYVGATLDIGDNGVQAALGTYVGGKYDNATFSVQPQVDAVNVCNVLTWPTPADSPVVWFQRVAVLSSYAAANPTDGDFASNWTVDSDIAITKPIDWTFPTVWDNALFTEPIAAGDLLILENQSSSSGRFTMTVPPSGWTHVPDGSTDAIQVWYSVTDDTLPDSFSATISGNTGDNTWIMMNRLWVIPAAEYTNFQITRQEYTSGTTFIAPDVTLDAAGRIIYVVLTRDYTTAGTPQTLPACTAFWPDGFTNQPRLNTTGFERYTSIANTQPAVTTTGTADTIVSQYWRIDKPRSGLVSGVTFTYPYSVPEVSILVVSLSN